jgi:4-hydroxybenzoyl-CoA thioesterase
MSAIRFERRHRIRFAHCDPAGIVFFPQYLVMLNGHVEDWISEALGLPYAHLIGVRRIGLPTVRLECDFRAVSRLGDEVVLALAVERVGTRSLTLRTEVVGADHEVRATLRQVLVSTDLNTHRAIELPADLRTAAEAFGRAPQLL